MQSVKATTKTGTFAYEDESSPVNTRTTTTCSDGTFRGSYAIPERSMSVGIGRLSGETPNPFRIDNPVILDSTTETNESTDYCRFAREGLQEAFRIPNGNHVQYPVSADTRGFLPNSVNRTFSAEFGKPKYCNNCLKHGHSGYRCKTPITSFGLITFRRKPATNGGEVIEYLMICRRDTLGFIDFMRGKYSVYDKPYILNMIVQMTVSEKHRLVHDQFNVIWQELWGGISDQENSQYSTEEHISRDKFNKLRSGISLKNDFYTLESLVESTRGSTQWNTAEWGFPKGRRNYQEKDYDCAVREFCEETGYTPTALMPIQNIVPYEEIFTGSNYKSYKHKYYLTYMPFMDSLQECSVQSSEVSCSRWMTYENCISAIRYYNVEKLRVLENAHQTITRFLLPYMDM
jgi:8-oxo-dGTP pyrophosphatase MutT (NUDIX family)